MTEDFETIELEYSEEDILYYLVDEDDTEVGFVIEENGKEVEYYYEGYDEFEFEVVEEAPNEELSKHDPKSDTNSDEDEEEHGYLYKMATIAGHEGNKVRQKAEKKLDKARGKAEVQAKKAKEAATEQAKKAKEKAEDIDLGITREDVAEMTSDLNAVAREGLDTARELKEAYDDIMGTFDFLTPSKGRRSNHGSGNSGLPGYKN